MKKFPSKKLRMSEKTVYSILWGCTIAAAGVVIMLTVFAIARRSDDNGPLTKPYVPDTSDSVRTSEKSAAVTPQVTKPVTPPTTDGNSDPVGADAVHFVAPAVGLLAKGHVVETLVYSVTMNDYRTHAGVDIEAQTGDPVFACADGVITGVYNDPMMGNCIEISHAQGYKSLYKNLGDELPEEITEGCSVKAGQIIAAVGDSARIELADESHLHFELYLNNNSVDPLGVIAQLQE